MKQNQLVASSCVMFLYIGCLDWENWGLFLLERVAGTKNTPEETVLERQVGEKISELGADPGDQGDV